MRVNPSHRYTGEIHVIPIGRVQSADPADRHRDRRALGASTVIVGCARGERPRASSYIIKWYAVRRIGRAGDDHAILEKFHQRNGAVKIAGLCGQRQETRRKNTGAHCGFGQRNHWRNDRCRDGDAHGHRRRRLAIG